MPDGPESLTLRWLKTVLTDAYFPGAQDIEGFTLKQADSQGATSRMLVIELHYCKQSIPSPEFIVAKFSSDTRQMRAAVADEYCREVDFYSHFGDDVGIPVPDCYFASFCPKTDKSLILLQYIPHAGTLDAKQMKLSQLTMLVDRLAEFHFKWRGREVELFDFGVRDELQKQYLEKRIHHCRASLAIIESRFGQCSGAASLLELMKKWLDGYPAIVHHIFAGVRTLCHNDFHPGQLAIPGQPDQSLYVFDWQAPIVGQGCEDIASLFHIQWPTNIHRKHEKLLLKRYHQQLCALGVKDYSFSRCWLDYRLSLIGLLIKRAGYFSAFGLEVLSQYWHSIDPQSDMWQGMYARQCQSIKDNHLLSAFDEVIASQMIDSD